MQLFADLAVEGGATTRLLRLARLVASGRLKPKIAVEAQISEFAASRPTSSCGALAGRPCSPFEFSTASLSLVDCDKLGGIAVVPALTAETGGAPVPPDKLVAPMLNRFMETDRALRWHRAQGN
ncbi:TPA: DUF2274 domain-containing protein [Pseudomonas aeruginosa]|nr:DUF2274 domain-containing protein [Sphingobium sp.]